MAVGSQGGSSAAESISQPPASDRAHYSHYRLMMSRSLRFESTQPASTVIWARGVAAQNTHTALDAAHGATRNVLLPYFCWQEASVFAFLRHNKPECCHYTPSKLMVVQFVTDMATTTACVSEWTHRGVYTDPGSAGGTICQSEGLLGSLKEPP